MPPKASGTDPDVLSTPAAGPAAVRGGAFRVGGYIVGALASAGSAALLFRHLGVVETGRYVTAMSLVAIVAALSDLGLTAVGIREISARRGGERWALAQDLLGLRIVLTILGVAGMTAITAVAYSGFLAAGVALAGAGLLLQAIQDNFAMSLTVELRLGWVSLLDLLRQLLTVAGIVVLAVTTPLVRGHRSLMPRFSRERWKPLVSQMLPFSLAVAASALYFRVSILLVSALSTKTELGYFSASFRMIEVLTIIPGLLANAAFPIFARAAHDDHDRLGYALGRVFQVALIVGAWLAVSIAVGARVGIDVIAGARFHPATSVLAIQGIALGAMFVSVVWANGMLSLGLYRQILMVSVGMLAFNAALVAVLVPIDGARGAAIGTAVSETLGAIVTPLIVVRGRPQLRPSLRVVPRVALAAALGLAPLALTGLPVIVRLAISTALFGGTLVATRALPEELRALIPSGGAGRR
jgi:O-antigen/teichoic acid export membrane protein